MILSLRKESDIRFFPSDYSEIKDRLLNPSRGWYRIFYFDICEKPDYESISYELNDCIKMVMVFVDIASLKNHELGENERNNLKEILDFFALMNLDVILRFAYDHKGKAKEREPSLFKTVLMHAEELISVLNENHGSVFILQGLLLGNWGEMHTSRYIDDEKLSTIYEIYNKSNSDIFLAVRKPSQWRRLNLEYAKTGNMDNIRTGIFNDGMFGSDTDLGTYGTESNKNVGYRSEWRKEEEYEFLNLLSEKCPIGGECVLNKEKNYTDFSGMLSVLRKTGVSYLNLEHDKDLIDLWKSSVYSGNGIWKGETVYNYIDAHMGYRFVIENVKTKKDRNGILSISADIKNTGFAPIYDNCDAYIGIKSAEEFEIHEIKGGLNHIESGEKKTLSAVFKNVKGTVVFFAKREKDKRNIFIAAKSDDEGFVILGRLE